MAKFSWDDLPYFLAVAHTGRLSAAARRLRSNHVTVSRRIDRLEQALSTRLFERNHQGYVLTIMGERLVERAERILREAEEFTSAALGSAGSVRGAVRLSTPEGFGNFFLASRLPQFAREYPSLTIEFVTIQQIVSLSRREADLMVTLQEVRGGPYRCEEIARYRLFVYASRDYLAAHPPIESRADVSAHRLIGYVEDMIFTPGLDYLPEILPGMRAGYQSSSIQAQLVATRSGYGLGILPYYLAREHVDLVPILPHELNLDRSYWVICHEDLVDAPRVRILSSFLKRQAAAMADVFTATGIGMEKVSGT